MKTITILLVDDHDLARRALRDLLESEAGLQVVGEADDGRAGVRLARKLVPHVVLMDVAMPELNGVEATRQLTVELPAVRILALSMVADRRLVKAMLEAGAVGYLLKDDATEELVGAVRAVAAGGRFLSRAFGDYPEAGDELSDELNTDPT